MPAWLDGLERLDLLALDDVDRVAEDPRFARPLFRLLDLATSEGRGLLLAATVPPQGLHFPLADLASRAAAATVYRLHALDDAAHRQVR